MTTHLTISPQRIVAMGGKQSKALEELYRKCLVIFDEVKIRSHRPKKSFSPKLRVSSRTIRDRDQEIEIINDISETITARINK